MPGRILRRAKGQSLFCLEKESYVSGLPMSGNDHGMKGRGFGGVDGLYEMGKEEDSLVSGSCGGTGSWKPGTCG